ncbi:Uncharacterised protein [Streptococcus pneumoniae]|nr:Uncharacterised protein [Streptococcus pneumoniae]
MSNYGRKGLNRRNNLHGLFRRKEYHDLPEPKQQLLSNGCEPHYQFLTKPYIIAHELGGRKMVLNPLLGSYHLDQSLPCFQVSIRHNPRLMV